MPQPLGVCRLINTAFSVCSLTCTHSKRKLREEKRPACNECRAHKLRCNAFLDYSRPCSRCLKKQVDCIVLDERRKKTSSEASPNAPSMSPPNEVTLQSQIPYVVRTSDSTSIQPSSSSSTSTALPSLRAENRALAPSMSAFEGDPGTESRTLGDIQVEAPMIDLCFAR